MNRVSQPPAGRMRSVALALCLWFSNVVQFSLADQALPDFRQLEGKFGIEIVTVDIAFPVSTKHGPIDGKVAPERSIQDYAPLFETEFGLYPPELVRRTGLVRVVLCTGLTFAGQRRNAVPDFEHHTLYLDVARGTHNRAYLRKVIHHEFFHIIDFRDDGSVYRDDRWAALNPPGFRYGEGGRNAQGNSETSVLTHKYPGFLNHYSTTGVEEDKAEIFANLIVDTENVEARAKSDMVLRNKCAAMKESLSKFSPAMGDAFWTKVRVLKRPAD